MGNAEQEIMRESLEQMRLLTGEVSGLRGEMVEFKNTIKERVLTLESSSNACQINPKICSTARKLEEHVARDKGRFGKVFTVLSFCLAVIALLVNMLP